MMAKRLDESEAIRLCCEEKYKELASRNAAEIEARCNEINKLESELDNAKDDHEKAGIKEKLREAWRQYNLVIDRLGV